MSFQPWPDSCALQHGPRLMHGSGLQGPGGARRCSPRGLTAACGTIPALVWCCLAGGAQGSSRLPHMLGDRWVGQQPGDGDSHACWDCTCLHLLEEMMGRRDLEERGKSDYHALPGAFMWLVMLYHCMYTYVYTPYVYAGGIAWIKLYGALCWRLSDKCPVSHCISFPHYLL